jgi:hypothetical protein
MSAKSDPMTGLIERLANHADPAGWMPHCTLQLSVLPEPGHTLLAYLDRLPDDQRGTLFDGSHDLSTHYKWLIHRSWHPRFTLWMHEYKGATDRGPGYAQVPHDHRYDVVSLILTGGYTATTWQVAPDGPFEAGNTIYSEADVMSLSSTEIHSLRDILPNTRTLVVEGPLIKHYSTAYYPGGCQSRRFPDFTARWPDLRAALAAPTAPDDAAALPAW